MPLLAPRGEELEEILDLVAHPEHLDIHQMSRLDALVHHAGADPGVVGGFVAGRRGRRPARRTRTFAEDLVGADDDGSRALVPLAQAARLRVVTFGTAADAEVPRSGPLCGARQAGPGPVSLCPVPALLGNEPVRPASGCLGADRLRTNRARAGHPAGGAARRPPGSADRRSDHHGLSRAGR